MKPLTHKEFEERVKDLKSLLDTRLQRVEFDEKILALGFYNQGLYWVVIDLNPRAPQIIYLSDSQMIKIKTVKKPLILFLQAHFVGHKLRAVNFKPDLGRVVELVFSNFQSMELRLFPHGQNILLSASEKKLALNKPKELNAAAYIPEVIDDPPTDKTESSERWIKGKSQLNENFVKKSDLNSAPNRQLQKLLSTRDKILSDLDKKLRKEWFSVGEWVKSNQSLNVPERYASYVNIEWGLIQNIENIFAKAKENERKIDHTKERLKILERQIEVIREKGNATGPLPLAPQILKNVSVKNRTIDLGSNLFFYIGKSAQDNLKLIRAAKPWSLWLHLKDLPSAHGLIHCDRGHKVTDEILHKAAQHLLLLNFGSKAQKHRGDYFDLVIAECRFVKPIKGDKLGRVSYTSGRTLRHRFIF